LIVNFNERISGTALGFLSFIKLIFAAFSILFIVNLVAQNYFSIFLLYLALYIISLILVFFLKFGKSVYTI
jgi:hypothetical protein